MESQRESNVNTKPASRRTKGTVDSDNSEECKSPTDPDQVTHDQTFPTRSNNFAKATNAADEATLLSTNSNASFPEKLMFLLSHVEKECEQLGKAQEAACIGWVLDGRAFVIREPTELVNRILPVVFHKAKFSSFTRKLYRWGFRQLNADNQDGLDTKKVGHKVFVHVYFQRDDKSLMKRMRSVTATSTRRAIASLNSRQDEAANRVAQLTQTVERPSSCEQQQQQQQLSFPIIRDQQQALFPCSRLMSHYLLQSVDSHYQPFPQYFAHKNVPSAIQLLAAATSQIGDDPVSTAAAAAAAAAATDRRLLEGARRNFTTGYEMGPGTTTAAREGLNALLQVAAISMLWNHSEHPYHQG